MTGMRNQLEFQSDRIETVLTMHGVQARVTGGTVTPRLVRFSVLPVVGSRISKIKRLNEELAAALDAPDCRIQRRGAAIDIEIPRDDPQPVRLLPFHRQLQSEHVPPATATLGLADDGTPLLIRLPSPDVAHILVAGTTGSGKTVLLQAMILSLAMLNRPDDVALVLIDPKGSAFTPFEPLPHLARPVIRDATEAAEALKSAARLMEQRQEGVRPYVVLMIDELADLLMVGGDEVQEPLTRLLQRGRSVGVHVVAATQKPTAAVLGSLVKANFPVRLVGRVTSATDARVAAGWSGTGAERLQGRGDFIAVAEGRLMRFQAAHVTRKEIQSVLEERGWNGSPRLAESSDNGREPEPSSMQVATISLPEPEPPEPEPEPDQVEELAQRLAPWWREHGGEWGAKTAAVHHLFGEDAPAGGHFWDLTMEAIERLEADPVSTSTVTENPAGTQPDWAEAFLEWVEVEGRR